MFMIIYRHQHRRSQRHLLLRKLRRGLNFSIYGLEFIQRPLRRKSSWIYYDLLMYRGHPSPPMPHRSSEKILLLKNCVRGLCGSTNCPRVIITSHWPSRTKVTDFKEFSLYFFVQKFSRYSWWIRYFSIILWTKIMAFRRLLVGTKEILEKVFKDFLNEHRESEVNTFYE